jgi:NADH:ubiquinone oxidoreductase subunit 5 (subunit L)/multisubunit Na+/H+ antiporter MnhA subunit
MAMRLSALNRFMCTFLLLFSSLTIFMAGLSANFEYDLKKIIALSTLSRPPFTPRKIRDSYFS